LQTHRKTRGICEGAVKPDRQIGSQFYERAAVSQNKAAMLEKAEVSESKDTVTAEEAIKDPFVLEFLNL
jgi:predicted nuclease of restriction endonuclease-like (RecB) superfamily